MTTLRTHATPQFGGGKDDDDDTTQVQPYDDIDDASTRPAAGGKSKKEL